MHEPEKKVDESWKDQVERERRIPEGQPAPGPGPGAPAPGGSAGAPPPGGAVPPAAPPGGTRPGAAPEAEADAAPPPPDEHDNPLFEGLVQSLAVQATMLMGATPDPRTGLVSEDLGQAKQIIDMIAVLELKTRGNLTAREAQLMQMILQDLRMAFVQRMQASQGAGVPGGPGPAAGGPAF